MSLLGVGGPIASSNELCTPAWNITFRMVFQVLKSVWSIVTENISVAFSFLYALLELLFSGGSTLFNLVGVSTVTEASLLAFNIKCSLLTSGKTVFI